MNRCWRQSKLAIEKGCGPNEAAKEHDVPKSTLKDRLSGRVVHGTNPGRQPHPNKKKIVGYGKTRRQVKCLVQKVAEEKGTLKESAKVSDGWWRRFLKRHTNLGRCKTENIRMSSPSVTQSKSWSKSQSTVQSMSPVQSPCFAPTLQISPFVLVMLLHISVLMLLMMT